MKRRDLIGRIEALASEHSVSFDFVGAGANHDKYRFNGKLIPIPRHREIGEGLVATIIKQCKSSLPEGDDQ